MIILLSAQSAALLGSCFSSSEATGSKSSLFQYEKLDLFCQWETIRCVVLDPANNRYLCALQFAGTHARTQTPVMWRTVWLWEMHIFAKQ